MDRILIVDDEESVWKPMAERMKIKGYNVAIAKNKQEALNIIENESPFDVAIVDMRLDKTSPEEEEGLKVVKALRNRDFFTRIIVLTAYASLENVYKAMEFDISQYINKRDKSANKFLFKAVQKAIEKRDLLKRMFQRKEGIPKKGLKKEGLKRREKQLLDGLKKERIIPEDKIEEALKEQKEKGGRIEDILIKKGFVEEGAINWVLSRKLKIPYVYLLPDAVDFDLVKSFPEELLMEYFIIPAAKIDINNEITLVMADPKDEEAINEIQKRTGCNINVFLGSIRNITDMLDIIFGRVIRMGKEILR